MADEDLARVLTLLHDSGTRWRTLHARGEEWTDPERSREALGRMTRPGSVVTSRGRPGRPGGDRRWRVWIRQPYEVRTEFGMPHGYTHVVIANRHRVCASYPDGGFNVSERQDEHDGWLGPAGTLVRPFPLSAALDLQFLGEESFLGRRVLTVVGRPRTGPDVRRFWGADEVRFAVDAERGVLLWLERRLDGAPYARTTMTGVAFDQDLDAHLFAVPEGGRSPDQAGPPTGPPPRPHPHPGPPDAVLGEPVGGRVILVREPSFVIAVDSLVAYPTGFELLVTVRTRAEPGDGGINRAVRRAWSGRVAFPSQSVTVRLTGDYGVYPVSGHSTHSRFDQRFWVEPLPAPGPLELVVAWPDRSLEETQVDVDGDAIREAATRAVALWP